MTLNNIRLLVVEDQNVVREEFVAILLFQSDIEVVGQTEDGIEALKRVEEKRPDVILLDLVMPRQDGLTEVDKILWTRKRVSLRCTPFLMGCCFRI